MVNYNIAIFASGNGSNAEKFFEYFRNHSNIRISCLLSNNADAYALTRASNNNVESRVFDRKELKETDNIVDYLKEKGVTHIVLAGFMWLVPTNLIDSFQNRIFNIHPALLPKFGGKGMYGDHVHNAVIENSGFSDRIDLVPGNFFENIPVKADIYLVSRVLHDWSDEECILILKKIAASAHPDIRLVIGECVIGDPNVPDFGVIADMIMMSLLGGEERRKSEFEAILNAAGFEMIRVIPTKSKMSLVEARLRGSIP